MRALDWLVRLVLMVISALATLALVGSLASVSNTPLGQAFPGDVSTRQDEPRDPSNPQADAPPARPDAASPVDAPTISRADRRPGTPVFQEKREDLARWLKALTYAVLALAGFAAAGLIALVRIARNLGRLAER